MVPYPTLGASNRLRVEQYAEPLSVEGIQLVVSPFFDDAAYRVLYLPGRTLSKALAVVGGIFRRLRDLLRIGRFDLVLIHRESAPLGPPLFERVLTARGVPYVFDFDDAIYLPAVHPANRRWSWLRRVNTRESVRRATLVVAGNRSLGAWSEQLNPRVIVIPTPVNAERYRVAPHRKGDAPVVIGWVGSTTTAPYLAMLDRVLATISVIHPIVVRVVGGRYEAPGVHVECIPFSIETEPALLESFDIGVLPEPDDEWARGKGAFKALLYMAAGLPVVASSVGANLEVIEDGLTGFCVADDGGWIEALERLIRDPKLRDRMGRAGRARLEQRYSLRVQAPRFAGALRSAVASAKGSEPRSIR